MTKLGSRKWNIYVYRTLDFYAPWLGNTDVKVLFLFERRICSIDNVKFFPFFKCGFGIWLNLDAVLRDSRATMCGIAVFVPPLRPPPAVRFSYFFAKKTSWTLLGGLSKVFFCHLTCLQPSLSKKLPQT